ncbi:uncharacterized protein G2W53_029603 [Senna tora]|uniref:Uncharacterized protein n=1 Tax=Senna tora TaxID=362788 RepID=A0A834T4Q0_9FABA|nr:uncharacterized protein G2W53_029603 [Senna tora]
MGREIKGTHGGVERKMRVSHKYLPIEQVHWRQAGDEIQLTRLRQNKEGAKAQLNRYGL